MTLQLGTIEFFVPGQPAPAGSKKAFYNRKANRAIIVDACDRTKPWQASVSMIAFEAMAARPLFEGPIRLALVFHLTRPKGHFGTGAKEGKLRLTAPEYPTGRPDVLKLARAVEDALSGVVYRDDAQIVMEMLQKIYSVDGRTGVGVKVETFKLEREPLFGERE